jgi:hypothetical protein
MTKTAQVRLLVAAKESRSSRHSPLAGRVGLIPATVSGVVVAVEAASGSERWCYETGFAPSQQGAWDVAVAGGLVVVPGAGFLLGPGESLVRGTEIGLRPQWVNANPIRSGSETDQPSGQRACFDPVVSTLTVILA